MYNIISPLKAKLSRLLLYLFTINMRIESDKVPTPKDFHIYYGGNYPTAVEKPLIACYQKIFSEPPWNEDWSDSDVRNKLKADLDDPKSFLVIYGDHLQVKGFAWGSIVHREEITDRAARAMCLPPQQIKLNLPKEESVLYCDEYAILKEARGGIEPLRHITKLFLIHGYNNSIRSTVFWSTPGSKIVPFTLTLGYEICGHTNTGNKKIIFLLNRNFISLLKAAKNMNQDLAAMMMSLQKKRRRNNT